MKTLEEILQVYFNCEKPFNDDANHTFTDEGTEAYKKLNELLDDFCHCTDIRNRRSQHTE